MTGALAVGALLAVAVALLAWPAPWSPTAAAPGAGTAAPAAPRRVPGSVRAPVAVVVVAAATAVAVTAGAVAAGTALAAVLAALVVGGERRRAQRRRCRDATRDEVDEALVLLAAELAAGRSPPQALAAAAEAAPTLLAEPARLASLGGDPVPGLYAAAARPGATGLDGVAAAWHVAVHGGAPLSVVLHRVRLIVQADSAATREAAEQVAPVRATARVLAVLPVPGVALGGAVGIDSLSLLTGTLWGQACLLLATVLVGGGLFWVGALVDAAVQR
jgi:tight adherence protein B